MGVEAFKLLNKDTIMMNNLKSQAALEKYPSAKKWHLSEYTWVVPKIVCNLSVTIN